MLLFKARARHTNGMRHQVKTRIHNGFTLVELSIVLVIIALIVGAIVAGQSLVNNSRALSILTDAQKYQFAVKEFQKKYGYKPGDFPQATSVWGRADGGSPSNGNCTGAPTIITATCNGDGSGIISSYSEGFLAWQQLDLAGLIEGAYTGIGGPAGNRQGVAGVNVPKAYTDGGMFYFFNTAVTYTSSFFINQLDQELLMFGAYNGYTTGNAPPIDGILPPSKAYQLDLKADDGLPASGVVIASNRKNISASNGTPCVKNYFGGATPQYDKSDVSNSVSAVGCALLFIPSSNANTAPINE